jgi:beta-lactamase family protein
MVSDDFRVEMIGHATLRVQCGGRTLLTDPWLVDPIVCNSAFHFPPLVHDPARLAAETDAIYLSHVHPDHFHRPSLALFSRSTPVVIGEHPRKAFREALRRLGFPVVEVPFQTWLRVPATGFEVSILRHDTAETDAYDSAIVIRTPSFTLFENNDCFLRPEKYAWVRERLHVDYAFLGYSPASFFPIAFEMAPEEKTRLLAEAAERRYAEFITAAKPLAPTLTVPFASGLRFLAESALWRNVCFNSAATAVRRAHHHGLAAEVMGPGDRIDAGGALRRVSRVLEPGEELAAIAGHARAIAPWIEELARQEPPADPDLVERFRNYLLALWRAGRDRLPGVHGRTIAYVLAGAAQQRFYFDFSRPDDEIFRWGEPPRYDMRYTYPASALQQRLDGRIDWDELHFANGVAVHQVRYVSDFHAMLRGDGLDREDGRGGEPAADPRSILTSSRART